VYVCVCVPVGCVPGGCGFVGGGGGLARLLRSQKNGPETICNGDLNKK